MIKGSKKPMGDKFMKFDIDPSTDCWIWKGSSDKDGYGTIGNGVKGSLLKAHRESYNYFVMTIPKGMHVLHNCDRPACINPDHLYLGTPKDNARDKVIRGRMNITEKMRIERRRRNYERPQFKHPDTGKFINEAEFLHLIK